MRRSPVNGGRAKGPRPRPRPRTLEARRMEPNELKPVLEALLFSAEMPLTLEQLAEATESETAPILEALKSLAADWAEPGRGLRLAEMAGGWIALTREEFAPFVGRLLRGKKKMRLSRPAL